MRIVITIIIIIVLTLVAVSCESKSGKRAKERELETYEYFVEQLDCSGNVVKTFTSERVRRLDEGNTLAIQIEGQNWIFLNTEYRVTKTFK